MALLEVMPTSVVVKRVLRSEEAAAPESGLIGADPYRHRLRPDVAGVWYGRHVLAPETHRGMSSTSAIYTHMSQYEKRTMKLMFFAMKLAPKTATDAL